MRDSPRATGARYNSPVERPAPVVLLRDTVEADLPSLFAYQLDPAAVQMAAFTPKDPGDREGFMARWAKLLADDTIVKKSVLVDGRVAGSVMSFVQFGHASVCYGFGPAYWGRGIATAALAEFLRQVPTRPLRARTAFDNRASQRVLEKCGFVVECRERGYANARGTEIEEVIWVLR